MISSEINNIPHINDSILLSAEVHDLDNVSKVPQGHNKKKNNHPRRRQKVNINRQKRRATSDLSMRSGSSSIISESARSQHGNKKGLKVTPKQRRAKKIKNVIPLRLSTPVVIEAEIISNEEKEKYVALDCEMVGVGLYGTKSAVGRVSIVNWEGDTIFDSFVQVSEDVTDYRTYVSGLRVEDIESDHAISYANCRGTVQNLLDGKILVGHALKNDFDCLNLSHPWHMIRDTAKFEPFMKRSKIDKTRLVSKKLKILAKDKLGIEIQKDGHAHCSIEDAAAAMDLYKKARKKWEKVVEYKISRTLQIVDQDLNLLQ